MSLQKLRPHSNDVLTERSQINYYEKNGHDFSHPDIMFSITVIIETPRQTAGKYVFDPVNHIYRLKKFCH